MERYIASAKNIDKVIVHKKVSLQILCYNHNEAKNTFHKIVVYFMSQHPIFSEESLKTYWLNNNIQTSSLRITLPFGNYLRCIPYTKSDLNSRIRGSQAALLFSPYFIENRAGFEKTRQFDILLTAIQQNERYLNVSPEPRPN